VTMAFYPGSKTPVRNYSDQPEVKPDSEFEFSYPDFKGTGFYTIGVLADVLNRSQVTVRKWEHDGVIPKPTYIRASADPRGRRRLYTRDQIMGIRMIAQEEGLLETNANGHWKSIEGTEFRERVLTLFRDLEKS